VKLLPQHITRLPERLTYMTTLVELGQIGAAERLEVAARLLVDMRQGLKLKQGVSVVLEGGSTKTWWDHALWKCQGPNGLDESEELVKQLNKFVAAFNKVAGEVRGYCGEGGWGCRCLMGLGPMGWGRQG
jgi:hypothetical protein